MDNSLELGWDSTSCDLEPLRSRVLALVKREQEAARAGLALVMGTVQQQLAQHQAQVENQQRDCSNCIMALFDSHRSVGASGTVSDGMDGSVRETCASMSSSVPTSSTSVTDRERVSKNYNARLSRPVTVSFSGVESLEHRVSRSSVVQSVTHAVGNWSTKINKRRCHCDRLKVVLTSQPFVLFIFSLIFVNSGMIAVTADLSIRDALADWSMRMEGRSGSSVTHVWLSLADSGVQFCVLGGDLLAPACF